MKQTFDAFTHINAIDEEVRNLLKAKEVLLQLNRSIVPFGNENLSRSDLISCTYALREALRREENENGREAIRELLHRLYKITR